MLENVPPTVESLPSSSKQESPYEVLHRRFTALEKENDDLKNELLIKAKDFDNLLANSEKLNRIIKELKNNSEMNIRELFKDHLTPNQLNIILKKKTKARWTAEEISKAFALRYFSKRAYIYMRETLKYPLPGISTLQSWAAHVDLRHGVLKDILKIMSISGQEKSALEKLTILSFDEIKVSSLIEYDQKLDEIVGPHSYMQVIMARGLTSQWKQPIYIGFDTKMTKQLLEEVIVELNKINFDVVACVSDCGGGNLGLWKELNITIEKTYFLHPSTNNKIYYFADVPHLLKLIRNWFLDHGFVLEDGRRIVKDPVRSLIELATTEISSCYKISQLHITCEKAQRQNVALAAQLMSNTTATALKRYLPGGNKQLAENVSEFFELINNWFDIMNSYTPSTPIKTKTPYGKDLELQNEILEKVKETFKTMRAVTKNSIQVFQKGVIISSTSVQDLYTDLKQRYKVSYILTHRLNQDCLENFFSQVCAINIF